MQAKQSNAKATEECFHGSSELPWTRTVFILKNQGQQRGLVVLCVLFCAVPHYSPGRCGHLFGQKVSTAAAAKDWMLTFLASHLSQRSFMMANFQTKDRLVFLWGVHHSRLVIIPNIYESMIGENRNELVVTKLLGSLKLLISGSSAYGVGRICYVLV